MSTRAEARSAEQALARLRSHLKLTLNLLLDDTVINLIALRVGEQPVKVRHALELLGGWFGTGRDAGAADAANEADGVDGWSGFAETWCSGARCPKYYAADRW